MPWYENNVLEPMTLVDDFTTSEMVWTVVTNGGVLPDGCTMEYSEDHSLHGQSLHLHLAQGTTAIQIATPQYTPISSWRQRYCIRFFAQRVPFGFSHVMGNPALNRFFYQADVVNRTQQYGQNMVALPNALYPWLTSGGMKSSESLEKNRLTIQRSASYEYDIYFQDIYVGGRSTPTLVCTWDDGTADHYTRVAPEFENRGLRCTFFTYPPATAGITGAQMLDLYDRGFDVQGHGVTSLNTLPVTAIRNEVLNNINPLLDLGLPVKHYAYPQGADNFSTTLDATTIPAILKDLGMHICRRTVGGAFFPEMEPCFDYSEQLTPGIAFWSITSRTAVADWITAVKNTCINSGMTLMLIFHQCVAAGGSGNQIDLADLQSFLDGILPYVRTGQLSVKTVSQYYDDLHRMSRRSR